jgi:hypothetical protein
MTEPVRNPLTTVLRYLLLVCGLFYLALFLFTALNRIGYRFELEWVEGNFADTVARLLNGQPIYAQPTVNFIANIYTPLFFYISAIPSLLMGVGFLPLRLVSLLSTLGCFVVIWVWVRREGGDAITATTASGLFAATYALGGAWFDLARTDMLYIALYLWAAYMLRFAQRWGGYFVASVLIFGAFFTKQSALFMIAPLFLYAVFRDWKKALAAIALLGLLIVGSTLWLDSVFNGWYSYFVWYLPSHFSQDMDWSNFIPVFGSELLLPLLIAFVIAIIFLVLSRKDKDGKFWFYLLLLLGVIAETIPARLSRIAYVNHMLPVYAVLAIIFGLGLGAIPRWIGEWKTAARNIMLPIFYLLCIVQFAILLYNPFTFIPTREDEAAGEHFLAVLGDIPGDIYVPAHSFIATYAGKPSHAHTTCIHVVVVSDPGAVSARLKQELAEATSRRIFPAYILDARSGVPGYQESGTVFERDDVFWTRSGYRTRPNYIYRVK